MTEPKQRWQKWVDDSWTERRPAPVEMSEAERYRWLSEYCNKFEYVAPTLTRAGHFVIIDCDGVRTVENNLSDAVEMAAGKFKERNGR
jgi:hypothetical protein